MELANQTEFIVGDVANQGTIRAVLSAISFREDFEFDVSRTWYTAKSAMDLSKFEIEGFQIVRSNLNASRTYAHRLYVNERIAALINCDSNQHLDLTVLGHSIEEVDAFIVEIQKAFPEQERVVEGRVRIGFWMLTKNGPQKIYRMIDAHEWENIEGNYPKRIRSDLGSLMSRETAVEGGQLMMWAGPAGTGKTHAIRALAAEWRDFCDFEYVTDPEVMFGEQAAYLVQVLLDSGEEPVLSKGKEDEKPRWKCLILEDTGEMLSADARTRVGQGLSRLLNVVDGLIGQGLRLLILITTNEEVGALHAAVTRPGRCASRLNFHEFDYSEATTWLKDHGFDADAKGSQSLAELYAFTQGRNNTGDVRRIGFAG